MRAQAQGVGEAAVESGRANGRGKKNPDRLQTLGIRRTSGGIIEVKRIEF